MDQHGTTYKRDKSICVKMYLKPDLFSLVAGNAERAGVRRKGLLLYTQKKNGLLEEKLANTDGISRYYKLCAKYYEEHEADRLSEAAKAVADLQEARARAQRLGLKTE